MGKVVDRAAAFAWSISKLAECFGIDRKTVLKRINQAGVMPAGESRGNPVYHINDVARAVHGPVSGSTPGKDWDDYPEARKAWWQSELYRIQFEEKMGQLIPDAEHARILAMVIKVMAAGIDSIPDLLEREAGLDPDQVGIVLDVLDGIRANMAEQLEGSIKSLEDSDDG